MFQNISDDAFAKSLLANLFANTENFENQISFVLLAHILRLSASFQKSPPPLPKLLDTEKLRRKS